MTGPSHHIYGPAIEVIGLTKEFGSFVAVNNISF